MKRRKQIIVNGILFSSFIALTTTFLPVACTMQKNNPSDNDDSDDSTIITPNTSVTVGIDGNKTLNVGDNLCLSPIITTNNSNIANNATYKWVVTKIDNTKTIYNDKVLNISKLDSTYNSAKIELIISIDGKDYICEQNILVINKDDGEKYFVQIKSEDQYIGTIGDILVKDIWDNIQYVKKLIIDNYYLFFILNDQSFDLNNNLEIISIKKDQSNADYGNLLVNIKINNASSNHDSLTANLKISGFKTNVESNQPMNGPDYFVLPNTDSNILENRITNPFTLNNEVIKKYGNAPLPWKSDSSITKNDIVNMFSYLTLYAKGIKVKFGERKIEANLFADAFVEWMIQYRKYFPYKSFDNPPVHFIGINDKGEYSSDIPSWDLNTPRYINETTWYINEVYWNNFDEIYEHSTKQENYIRFINKLFRYVQPEMSDLEKLFLCINFTSNWLWYNNIMTDPPFDNGGVCADYANLLSFALSILDVPSFPIECGYQAASHAIVWTYLDLYGNGEKKWYATDTTAGDYNNSKNSIYEGVAALALPNDQKGWFLFDVAVDQFTPINSLVPGSSDFQEDISNQLFGLPWSGIGNNTSSIGKASYGKINDYVSKYFDYLFTKKYTTACFNSRNFYINGYSYYFSKNTNSSSGVSLYKRKLEINSPVTTVNIELPTQYANKFTFSKSDGNNYEYTYPPLVQQFGNKILLLLNPAKSTNADYHRSILVIDTTEDGINWDSCREYAIPQMIDGININQNYIFNMDVDLDGILRLDCGENYRNLNASNLTTLYVDLGANFKKEVLFNKDNNNRQGDLLIAKQYYSSLISMYRIGENKNGFLPYQKRMEFYNFMNQEIETSNNYYESIMRINAKYHEIADNILVYSVGAIPNKILDQTYVVLPETFRDYGFQFNNIEIYDSPEDMVGISYAHASYNVYFSTQKPTSVNDLTTFTKVVDGAKTPKVDEAILSSHGFSSGDGYYYVEIVTQDFTYQSNVCRLLVTKELDYYQGISFAFYSESVPGSAYTRITNYSDSVWNWYQDNIKFKIDVTVNPLLFPSKYEYRLSLKKIDITTKECITVKNHEDFSSLSNINGGIKGTLDLGIVPSESSHGIYFIEMAITNRETHETFKNYSKFQFILTQEDYYNWDKTIWINAIESYIKNM